MQQDGVLRRRDLKAAGWGDAAIHRGLLAGRLVRVARDRYVTPGVVAELARVVAVPGTRTALCGGAALRAYGLPVDSAAVEVAIPHGCRRRALPRGVVVRQARSWSARQIDGVAVVDLATALLGHARRAALVDAVIALDAAGHQGLIDLDALAGRLAARGDRRARRAFSLADRRSESPLESRLRLLLVLAGLPPDGLQRVIREQGRFVARVDLWYAGLVVEADGYEFHRERADYRADRRKGQAYARLGLLVLRFSWEDVVSYPDAVVETVRAALRCRNERWT